MIIEKSSTNFNHLKNCYIRYDFLHNLRKLAKCVKGRFELWWNIIRISFWKIFSNIKLFHRIWSLLNSLIELVYLIFHPTFLQILKFLTYQDLSNWLGTVCKFGSFGNVLKSAFDNIGLFKTKCFSGHSDIKYTISFDYFRNCFLKYFIKIHQYIFNLWVLF